MPPFRLLAEPERYVPCDWDLTADRDGLAYWVAHFREHFHTLADLIRAEYAPADGALDRFADEYLAEIDRLAHSPEQFGRVTILTFDSVRDRYLRAFGFPDPFAHVKRKENEAALAFYPRLIAELDGRPDDLRLDELVRGVFAGNIFDLGAMATVKHYRDGGLDFFATRADLSPRPWRIDDLDAMMDRWSPSGWRYRKVVFLADNAGCDFVLGCLPLIREFACRRVGPGLGARTPGRRDADTAATPSPPFSRDPKGSAPPPAAPAVDSPAPPSLMDNAVQVVIAVNTGPSLNDILPDEVAAVLAAARRTDPLLDGALSAGRIRVVTTGNAAPLIDLSQVGSELNAAAEGADLLVLEGMGRSVESNHHARFTVDTAKLALLKDPRVAARIGGRTFDICCKFEPAD